MMDKDTIEKLKYESRFVDGIIANLQEHKSRLECIIQEEEELQRIKFPELEVIDPEMSTWK